jgi:hypothetical protein
MKIQDKNYVLNFTGGHLEVPISDVYNLTQAITIAAWIKPTSGEGLQATILSKDYTIYEPQVQNGKLVFERGPEYSSASNITLNTWAHIAITFDASLLGGNLKLYINGQLDKSYDLKTPLSTGNKPIWMGARSQSTLPYSGQMAGVAIWNSAHNSWQILQNYNQIDATASDLVSYWPMDEGSGSITKDVGKSKLDARFNGAVQWQAVDTPIMPSGTSVMQRVRHTSIQRVDQLKNDPDDSHIEDHAPLPSSGRNGEATKLLNYARQHKVALVSEQQIKNNQIIQASKASNAEKIKQAHIDAAKKMNSTRFDSIWFIYEGLIHRINPQGARTQYTVGGTDTVTKSVAPNSAEKVNTGITVNLGDGLDLHFKGLNNQGDLLLYLDSPRAGPRVVSIKSGSYSGFCKLHNIAYDGKLSLGIRDTTITNNIDVEIVHTTPSVSVPASDLMVDEARNLVFWSQATQPFSLHVANIDGSGKRMLVEHPEAPITSVALDETNQYVYHIVGTGKIMRVKYDGSDHRELLDISGPAKDHYWQIEIDAKVQKMYWTNDYSIWRANVDGSCAELVVGNHDAPFPIDIAIDSESEKLYWVDKDLEVVRRANFNGDNPEDLYTAKHPVRGLTLDYVSPEMSDQLKQEVYWVSREESITAQTPGIKGHWSLDEGEGDYLHNNIDPFNQLPLGLLRTNTDLPKQVDSSHYAIHFTGVDQAQIPNVYMEGIQGNSFTISLWVKPNRVPAKGDAGFISNTNYTTNKCLVLLLRDAKPYMGFYNNDLSGKTAIEAGKWTHLAFSYDLAKKEQAIFINGVLDSKEGGHAPLEKIDTSTLVGAYNNACFDGLITGIRINLQALNSQEIIQQIATPDANDLIKHIISRPFWNHSETPPTLVEKKSVLAFNGVSTYSKLGNAVSLGLYQQSFTVECWVQIKEATTGDLPIIGTELQTKGQGLHFIIRNNKPYMGFYNDDLASNTTIKAGEWVHVVWRFDASKKEQSIFINGNKDISRISNNSFMGQGDVALGRSYRGVIFNGNLSDLKIWNTARSNEEIASNYRHYRVSFAFRGAVDGSTPVEHLFDVPAEGGLNLTSQLKKEFEQRVLAYRKRKENQAIATKHVQIAHTEKTEKIAVNTKKLQVANSTATSTINAKKAHHEQDRTANRAKLTQAQNNKSSQITTAQQAAKKKAHDANVQAGAIKNKANTEASQLKSSATAKRNKARAARDKNRH